MVRAHCYDFILDRDGKPITSAEIYLYDAGTTDEISETIYDSDGGAGTLSQPLSVDSGGFFEFFLAAETRLDLLISASGWDDRTLSDVDVVAVGLFDAHGIDDGSSHTLAGSTAGHILRATSATAFEMGAMQDGDLPSGTTGSSFTVDSDASTPKITLASQGSGSDYTATLKPAAALSANREITLPNAAGEVALDSELHTEAHTVASHSDTTGTGAELETLTDGSDADSLHSHSSLATVVRKTEDISIASDATVNNDADLAFSVGANESWVFEVFLSYDSATDSDLTVAFTASAAVSSLRWGAVGLNTSATLVQQNATGSGTELDFGGEGVGTDSTLLIRGSVEDSGNAVTVTLQWAQESSKGTNTTVHENSHLLAHKV